MGTALTSRPAAAPPAPGTCWTLHIRPPVRVLSMNSHPHWAEIAQWRTAAYLAARAHKPRLPQGLDRVRIDVVFRFTDRRARDRQNLRATTKPIVDGLGPAKPKYKTIKGRRMQVGQSVGYGLIVDDNDAHLDGEHITIGAPVPRQASGIGGFVEVVITVLPPLGAAPLAEGCGCLVGNVEQFGHSAMCKAAPR